MDKKTLSLESQEMFLSLMIEPYSNIVDKLSSSLSTNERNVFYIDGSISVKSLKMIIEKHYTWVLSIDFNNSSERQYIWYTSIEKQEPRLGDRYKNKEINDYEQPLCIAYDVYNFCQNLSYFSLDNLVADVLKEHPKYRHVVRRIQLTAHKPYAEICSNLTPKDMSPVN